MFDRVRLAHPVFESRLYDASLEPPRLRPLCLRGEAPATPKPRLPFGISPAVKLC